MTRVLPGVGVTYRHRHVSCASPGYAFGLLVRACMDVHVCAALCVSVSVSVFARVRVQCLADSKAKVSFYMDIHQYRWEVGKHGYTHDIQVLALQTMCTWHGVECLRRVRR